MRLLALDDDPVFPMGIARMLRSVDCALDTFEEPERALVHLTEASPERALPDLLLIDHHMPRMDGLEFASRASIALGAFVPTLYLVSAGAPARADAAEALRLGVTVIDKAVALPRAWLGAAVQRCREPAGLPPSSASNRYEMSRR